MLFDKHVTVPNVGHAEEDDDEDEDEEGQVEEKGEGLVRVESIGSIGYVPQFSIQEHSQILALAFRQKSVSCSPLAGNRCGMGTWGQLLRKNVKRFRGGLVFKAHRLVYHSSPGWRVIKKKKEKGIYRTAVLFT